MMLFVLTISLCFLILTVVLIQGYAKKEVCGFYRVSYYDMENHSTQWIACDSIGDMSEDAIFVWINGMLITVNGSDFKSEYIACK